MSKFPCVGHDPAICAAGDEYERRHPQTYQVQLAGGRWRDVTKTEWVAAERSAGFHNTMGHPDEPGTGGFGNSLGINGRIIERRRAHQSSTTEGASDE